MSACYSVTINITTQKAKELSLYLNEFADKEEEGGKIEYARSRIENYDREKLEDFLHNLIAAEYGLASFCKKEDIEKGIYHCNSGFNASYGWELVLYDNFKRMVDYVDKGKVVIEPDEGATTITFKDGKINFKYK